MISIDVTELKIAAPPSHTKLVLKKSATVADLLTQYPQDSSGFMRIVMVNKRRADDTTLLHNQDQVTIIYMLAGG